MATINPASVTRDSAGHPVRVMSLTEYTASRPPNPMFPPTSDAALKVVMLLVYLMIAAGIVYVVVESVLTH